MSHYTISADGVPKLSARYYDSATVALHEIDVERAYPDAVVTTQYFKPDWERATT